MLKAIYVLIGVLLFGGAVGFMGYRVAKEPDLIAKYEWMLDENAAKPDAVEKLELPRTRSATPSPDAAGDGPYELQTERRAEDRQRPSADVNNVKLFEYALDVGNILVGLIGIYLALTNMRGRRA